MMSDSLNLSDDLLLLAFPSSPPMTAVMPQLHSQSPVTAPSENNPYLNGLIGNDNYLFQQTRFAGGLPILRMDEGIAPYNKVPSDSTKTHTLDGSEHRPNGSDQIRNYKNSLQQHTGHALETTGPIGLSGSFPNHPSNIIQQSRETARTGGHSRMNWPNSQPVSHPLAIFAQQGYDTSSGRLTLRGSTEETLQDLPRGLFAQHVSNNDVAQGNMQTTSTPANNLNASTTNEQATGTVIKEYVNPGSAGLRKASTSAPTSYMCKHAPSTTAESMLPPNELQRSENDSHALLEPTAPVPNRSKVLTLPDSDFELSMKNPDEARAHALRREKLYVANDDIENVKARKETWIRKLMRAIARTSCLSPQPKKKSRVLTDAMKVWWNRWQDTQQSSVSTKLAVLTAQSSVESHAWLIYEEFVNTHEFGHRQLTSNFKPDKGLKCSKRLEEAIKFIEDYAIIRKNVLGDVNIPQFAANPKRYVELKTNNLWVNLERKRRNTEVDDDSEAPEGESKIGGVKKRLKAMSHLSGAARNQDPSSATRLSDEAVPRDQVTIGPNALEYEHATSPNMVENASQGTRTPRIASDDKNRSAYLATTSAANVSEEPKLARLGRAAYPYDNNRKMMKRDAAGDRDHDASNTASVVEAPGSNIKL